MALLASMFLHWINQRASQAWKRPWRMATLQQALLGKVWARCPAWPESFRYIRLHIMGPRCLPEFFATLRNAAHSRVSLLALSLYPSPVNQRMAMLGVQSTPLNAAYTS